MSLPVWPFPIPDTYQSLLLLAFDCVVLSKLFSRISLLQFSFFVVTRNNQSCSLLNQLLDISMRFFPLILINVSYPKGQAFHSLRIICELNMLSKSLLKYWRILVNPTHNRCVCYLNSPLHHHFY